MIGKALAQLSLLDADFAIFSGFSARKAASIKEGDFKRVCSEDLLIPVLYLCALADCQLAQ